VVITESDLSIRLQKRAPNPLLIAAGFHNTAVSIPWLAHKRLQIRLG
jgi:hypothetical protein